MKLSGGIVEAVPPLLAFVLAQTRLDASRQELEFVTAEPFPVHGLRSSQTNREAILSCDTTDRLQGESRQKLKPLRIRRSAHLNNRIEQDHRALKRRVRLMLGFKSIGSTHVILGGIELVHMMRKGQAKYAWNSDLSLAEQFERLVA